MNIAEVLSPLTLREFVERHWGRGFAVYSGAENRFRALLDWTELGRVLASQEWRDPRLRVIRQGRPVSLRPPFDFERLFHEQCVLALTGADECFPGLRRLAGEFEYAFRERTQVNVYAGYAGACGFALHWDDHEVFVLQAEGRKYWRVFGPTSDSPLDHGEEEDPPPADPLWEGVLSAGSWLYMPRGYWHQAEGVEGAPSLHLTVGVDRATGVDLLERLAREVRASAQFRRDLPRFADAAAQRAAARELAAELRAHLDETWVERFLAADDAAAPARRSGGLTGGEPGVLRFLPPRPVNVRVEDGFGRFLEFEALGREWHVPRWTEPVLRLLAERREIARGEVLAQIPDAGAAIDYLIGVGLAEETSGQ